MSKRKASEVNDDVEIVAEDHDLEMIADLMESEHGPASERQDASARSKFNKFLATYKIAQDITKLTRRSISKETFGMFATYLLEDSVGWQTSMSYLSSIRRQLEKIHKTDLFEKNSRWYTSVRSLLNKKYVEKALRTGKKLKEQAPPMTMDDLLLIGKALFHKNTKTSSADRLLINQQWLSIGRSSDVGSLCYDDLSWMGTYVLVDLTRLKTRRQQKISIFCSNGQWQVDPFHSLACLLLADKFATSNFIFSQVSVGLEERKVASYINRLLQCVYQYVQETNIGTVTPNLQSHSTRRGSAVVAASNPNVSIADVGNRGQWTLDSFSTVFEYICTTRANDEKVAKVLGGWHDPQHCGYPPANSLRSD